MLFIICELFLFLKGRSDQTLDIYRNQGKQVGRSRLFNKKALLNSQCYQLRPVCFFSVAWTGVTFYREEKSDITKIEFVKL